MESVMQSLDSFLYSNFFVHIGNVFKIIFHNPYASLFLFLLLSFSYILFLVYKDEKNEKKDDNIQ